NTSAAATASALRPAGMSMPMAPATTSANAVSQTRIDIMWGPGANATSYRLERKGPTDANFIEIAAGLIATGYTDNAVSAGGTYAYRVRSENSAGLSGYGPLATATTAANAAFTGVNVGVVRPAAGSTAVVTEGRDYDVTAGGADIQGTADQFHFAYRQRSGDFDVKVRVASLTRAH